VRLKQFEKVRRWRNLNAVHCPTLELAVMPNKEYNIASRLENHRIIVYYGITKSLTQASSSGTMA